MKKITGILAMMAIVSLLASSCKTHEKCPAYGQVPIKTENRKA